MLAKHQLGHAWTPKSFSAAWKLHSWLARTGPAWSFTEALHAINAAMLRLPSNHDERTGEKLLQLEVHGIYNIQSIQALKIQHSCDVT
jgi:hypothetical protein